MISFFGKTQKSHVGVTQDKWLSDFWIFETISSIFSFGYVQLIQIQSSEIFSAVHLMTIYVLRSEKSIREEERTAGNNNSRCKQHFSGNRLEPYHRQHPSGTLFWWYLSQGKKWSEEWWTVNKCVQWEKYQEKRSKWWRAPHEDYSWSCWSVFAYIPQTLRMVGLDKHCNVQMTVYHEIQDSGDCKCCVITFIIFLLIIVICSLDKK